MAPEPSLQRTSARRQAQCSSQQTTAWTKGKAKAKAKAKQRKAKHALPADGCSGPLRCATMTAMPEDCGNEAEQLFALDVADADNFERVELKAKRRKQKTDSAVSAESQQLNDETTAAE